MLLVLLTGQVSVHRRVCSPMGIQAGTMHTERQACSQAGVLTGKEGVHIDMEPGAGEVPGGLQGQDLGIHCAAGQDRMQSVHRRAFADP